MTENNSSFLVTFFTPRGSEFQSESELVWSLYIYIFRRLMVGSILQIFIISS